ncbi:hypothetical protein ColTof3_04941 [Colletotrichum tofieldiae]|nr:hypothetical protein ColTof3_04941 [Colletotrichum tofieldiae]
MPAATSGPVSAVDGPGGLRIMFKESNESIETVAQFLHFDHNVEQDAASKGQVTEGRRLMIDRDPVVSRDMHQRPLKLDHASSDDAGVTGVAPWSWNRDNGPAGGRAAHL